MTIQPFVALAERTVRDIMHHQVVTVLADTPLSEAARTLWDERVSGVPVLDASRRPIGFLSASDVVRYQAFGMRYVPPATTGQVRGLTASELAPLAPGSFSLRHTAGETARVRDVMTPVTISVHTTTSVPALARFLVRAGIHHALVIDDGELVGIVSTYDVVQELAELAPAEEETELPAPFRTDVDAEC
jgi:CBS domain-containing protein